MFLFGSTGILCTTMIFMWALFPSQIPPPKHLPSNLPYQENGYVQQEYLSQILPFIGLKGVITTVTTKVTEANEDQTTEHMEHT